MNRKGKLVAFATLGAGIAILLIALIAAKDWILEEWHIRQLKQGSRAEALAAARSLGERKCARAVRPLLRAMRRACNECNEWLGVVGQASDSALVARLVIGPASITEENVPETLPPGYEHLELLRTFHRIGDRATPDLLRALLEEEDALTARLAANVLIRLLGTSTRGGSFGVWVHFRDHGTVEVLPYLERLRDSPSADAEARRLAAAVLVKLGP